jgi:hypothetical protein
MRASAVKGTARAVAQFREGMAAVDRPGPRPDPRLPLWIERLLLKLFGRTIKCAACGRQLFVGLPLVWRGELWLIGAYDHELRVSWVTTQTMEFTHVRLDECPAPERPWAA